MADFISVADYKAKASQILPQNALGYYNSGAGNEYSLRLNCSAFERYNITLIISPEYLYNLLN